MKLWIYDIGSSITRGPASDEQIAKWNANPHTPLVINYHGCPTKVELRMRPDWKHTVKTSAPVYPPKAPPINR